MSWNAESGQLVLSCQGLTEWPRDAIQEAGAENVRWLCLAGNALAELPGPELAALANLEALLLSGNRLAALPDELSRLSALRTLDVSHNALEAVPPAIAGLASLQRLYLHGNRLERLPPALGRLAALERLDVSQNRLRALPAELGGLPRLAGPSFFCGGNPLPEMPPWARACADGDALLEFLRSGAAPRRERLLDDDPFAWGRPSEAPDGARLAEAERARTRRGRPPRAPPPRPPRCSGSSRTPRPPRRPCAPAPAPSLLTPPPPAGRCCGSRPTCGPRGRPPRAPLAGRLAGPASDLSSSGSGGGSPASASPPPLSLPTTPPTRGGWQDEGLLQAMPAAELGALELEAAEMEAPEAVAAIAREAHRRADAAAVAKELLALRTFECPVCLQRKDRSERRAIEPCGHVLCAPCAAQFRDSYRPCPVDRGRITGFLRIYD
eukprot:tig00000241_g21068.t1